MRTARARSPWMPCSSWRSDATNERCGSPPMRQRLPIELFALLYLLAYLPYVLVVRWLATVTYPPLGRPLSGLEILPATMILSGVLTLAYVCLSGWSKDAHHRNIL